MGGVGGGGGRDLKGSGFRVWGLGSGRLRNSGFRV